jgi:hypothetical protein
MDMRFMLLVVVSAALFVHGLAADDASMGNK